MKRMLASILSGVMICMACPTGGFAAEEQNPQTLSGGGGGTEVVTNTAAEPNLESNTSISQSNIAQYASDGSIQTPEQYEALLTEMMNGEGQTPEALASSKDFLTILLKHRLVSKVGYELLTTEMNNDPSFKEAMEWLFSDYETLQYFVYGGEPDNWDWDGRSNIATPDTYLKSFQIFSKIFKEYSGDIKANETATYSYGDDYNINEDKTLDKNKLQNRGLFKRLMVAIALTHTSEICMWNKLSSLNRHAFNYFPQSDPVGRYELYKKLYIHDLLVADFDKYNVDELRMVVGVMIDNTQLEWMNYYYRQTFMSDTDYLTSPDLANASNVGGYCGMRYTAFCTQPACMGRGGTGDKYYIEENRDQWTDKYLLERHDGVVFDFKVPYGPLDKDGKETAEKEHDGQLTKDNKYYSALQWTEIDAGSVCFGISNTATVVRCAFGLPTVINEELPNHCAYFIYTHTNIDKAVTKGSGDLVLGLGYDAYGITAALPYFHRYAAAGWGDYSCSSVRNGIYMIYGMDAMFGRFDNTDANVKHETIMTGMSDFYLKAFNLTLAGDLWQGIGDRKEAEAAEDYNKAINLYNKALEAQNGYFPAFIGLADCYKKAGKSDEEFLKLAQQAAESRMWYYAMPLSDYIINYLIPKMTETAKKADAVFVVEEKLREAQNLSANNSYGLAQPSYSVALANYCLSTIKKVASFTFESGAITVSADYADLTGLEYSVDGGSNWINAEKTEESEPTADGKETAKPAVYKLNGENIGQISVTNGLRYKFSGCTKQGLIPFTQGATPVSNQSTNTPDDNNDRVNNLEKGLEYSLTGNGDWQDLTTDTRFQNDDITVYIRRKATGTTLASAATEVEFTKSEGTPDFSFLNNDNITKLTVDTSSYNANTDIKYANDGKPGTYFENMYTNTEAVVTENGRAVRDPDNKFIPRQAYEFVLTLKNPHYIAGLKYQAHAPNTAITGLNVYASVDGKSWNYVDSADSWENTADEQTLQFDYPAYAQYIKLLTTKVPTEPYIMNPASGNMAHFTVAEWGLYENYAVLDKTPTALTVSGESDFKSEYRIGDKPALDKLIATLEYEDGAKSIVPTSALQCDVNIFTSTETKALTFTYQGLSDSVGVTVTDNDRVPTEIQSVTARARKYYENDTVDKNDVEVAVANGAETWYLLPDQFTIEGQLKAGDNDLTVTVPSAGLQGTLKLNADKAVTGLSIETPEGFQTQYFIGVPLDLTDMTVNLQYANGETRVLNENEYTMDLYMEKAPEEVEESLAALEDEPETEDEKIIIPVDRNEFGKTPGTVKMRITLNDKAEINDEKEFTVLSYITNGEFSFNVNNDNTTCTLTEYTPAEEKVGYAVTVPEQAEINGLTFPVTEIAANAFESAADMEAVSLPKTVQTINANAFPSCDKLAKIYMLYHEDLSGFTCADNAFSGSGTLYLSAALAAQYPDTTPIPRYPVANIATDVERIELVPPTKTDYILGEDLDLTGMTVTAVLQDSSRVETQNYTVSYEKTVVSDTVPVTVTINDTNNVSGTFTIKIAFPEVKITKQPENGAYQTNTPIQPLTVEATAEFDNPVKYQWYTCSDETGSEPKEVSGAAAATYDPGQAGYYYVEAYVEDGEGNRSKEAKSDIVQIAVKDFPIIAGGKGYDSLKDALEEIQSDCTVTLYADVTVDNTINVPGKHRITLEGNEHTVKRGSNAKQQMLLLKQKANLTLSHVTIDGGAIWEGETDPVLNRGMQNKGLSVGYPMIETMEQASLTLTNGTVLQNSSNTEMNGYPAYPATGAVKVKGASLTVDNAIIRNNYSENNASAIFLTSLNGFSSSLKMKDSEVYGNYSGYWAYVGGSAISVMGGSAQITGGKFYNNKSHEQPSGHGGSISQGGAITISGGTLSISNGEFYNNSVGGISNDNSKNAGGAIGCSGGTTNIINCTFTNNTGRYGGAVGITGSAAVTIDGGTFTENKAKLGGAVYNDCAGGSLNISNAVIQNNSAENGSAVHINRAATLNLNSSTLEGNTAEKDGTIWSKGPVRIGSLSFIDNTAEKGTAIYTDYTEFTQTEGIRISSLTEQMQEIYMKKFLPIFVYGDLQGKPFAINTETKIEDGTEVLTLLGRETENWNIQGTINERAITVKEDGKMKRKPIAGTSLAALTGAVSENEDTASFDEGFVTGENGQGIDLTGCKTLAVTFRAPDGASVTLKYSLSDLFNGNGINLADARFGLIIHDIPMGHRNDTISIAFTDGEPYSEAINTMLMRSRNLLGLQMGLEIVPEAETQAETTGAEAAQ